MSGANPIARSAGLGAAAEACVVALPLATLILPNASGRAIVVFVAPWVCLSGVAAAGAALLRSDEGARAWLVAAAVVAGSLFGRGSIGLSVIVAALALALGLRLFQRATREDPAPTATELWIWTVILGTEAALAALVRDSTWAPTAVVLIPAALTLGLAARAAALWPPDRRGEGTGARASGGRLGSRLAFIPVLGSLLAVAVAGAGGPLDRIGGVAGGVLKWLATLVALVGSLVIFPIAWGWKLVVGHTTDLQGFLDRIRHQQTSSLAHPSSTGASPLLARLIGLVVLLAVAWLASVLVRRVRTRKRTEAGERATPPLAESVAVVTPREEPSERRLRRRLPRDRVRRRYAELLLLLRKAGLGKEPGQTPREYLAVVAATYPGSRPDFEAITRVYELVRYAERLPADTPMRAIDAAARRVRREVRRQRALPI